MVDTNTLTWFTVIDSFGKSDFPFVIDNFGKSDFPFVRLYPVPRGAQLWTSTSWETPVTAGNVDGGCGTNKIDLVLFDYSSVFFFFGL